MEFVFPLWGIILVASIHIFASLTWSIPVRGLPNILCHTLVEYTSRSALRSEMVDCGEKVYQRLVFRGNVFYGAVTPLHGSKYGVAASQFILITGPGNKPPHGLPILGSWVASMDFSIACRRLLDYVGPKQTFPGRTWIVQARNKIDIIKLRCGWQQPWIFLNQLLPVSDFDLFCSQSNPISVPDWQNIYVALSISTNR